MQATPLHVVREAVEASLTTAPLKAGWSLVVLEYPQHGPPILNVRMPSVDFLDDLYQLIEEVCTRLNVKCKRVGRWHSVAELGGLLGAVEWLWKQWLPRGFLTLLVAEPGTGKSMLALDFIRRAIDPALGWPMTPAVYLNGAHLLHNTVWIESESSHQLLSERSRGLGIDQERILLVNFKDDIMGQPNMMADDDKARVIRLVEESKPQLIVVDSLGGAQTGGENRIEDVRGMLDFFARLSRDNNTGAVGVHHLRKRSNEGWDSTLDRVRGSTAFVAFPRIVLALDNMPDGEHKKLSVIKSNLSKMPPPLLCKVHYTDDTPTGVSYSEFVAPKSKVTKQQQAADWVYNFLKQGDGAPTPFQDVQDAAQAEGYTRQILYKAKDILGDVLQATVDGRRTLWELVEPLNPLGADYEQALKQQTQEVGQHNESEQDPLDV